jgi:hypothetical protein
MGSESIVVSASGLALFARCRKAYELAYVKLLDVPGTSAMADGTAFHAYAAAYARERRGDTDITEPEFPPNDAMFDVFLEWVRRCGAAMLDAAEAILHVEEPLYRLFTHPNDFQSTLLRYTPDLVYRRKDGWIIVVDYKTFEKAPSLDIDLDFQARLYLALVAEKYGRTVEDRVLFRHVNVRRCVPGTKNSKGVWSEDDCYIDNDILISRSEAATLLREADWKLYDLSRQVRNAPLAPWYRTELKGNSPHTCGSCLYKNLCKAELIHGELTPEMIAQYAVPRKPLELPEKYKPKTT